MQRHISTFQFGIFDIEGTLLNNRAAYRFFLALALRFPYEWCETPYYLPTGSFPLPSWTAPLAQISPLARAVKAMDMFALTLLTKAESKVMRNIKVFEGTEEVLKELRSRGIVLFGSTGSRMPYLYQHLKNLGLFPLFQDIVGVDRLDKRCHIPYFAQQAGLSLLHFANATFLVGDGPVDLALAKDNGVYGVGITHTLPKKTLLMAGAVEVISHLRELVA